MMGEGPESMGVTDRALGAQWSLQRGNGGPCYRRGLSWFREFSGHLGRVQTQFVIYHTVFMNKASHLSLSSSTRDSESTWCQGTNLHVNVVSVEIDKEYQANTYDMLWQIQDPCITSLTEVLETQVGHWLQTPCTLKTCHIIPLWPALTNFTIGSLDSSRDSQPKYHWHWGPTAPL